jgi:DNA replication ATP-dependent helicase Dna2
MPYLNKKVIRNFLQTQCMRRLRIDLSPDNSRYASERESEGMPQPDSNNQGLKLLAQEGEKWEQAKIQDLEETFGQEVIVGDRRQGANQKVTFDNIPIATALAGLGPGKFIIQGELTVTPVLEKAMGLIQYRETHGLSYGTLRPDIIQVLAPGTFEYGINPDGTEFSISSDDERLQLRVIDIKLTAEPSAAYFAEVTYYSLVLAAWLVENNLNERFVVVPNAAIWPGSHAAAAIVVLQNERHESGTAPSPAELFEALNKDLEEVAFEVFVSRLRTFFRDELQQALTTPWQKLEWHIDGRCRGCEYLGYPRYNFDPDPNHCYQEALRSDDVSRVPFISRGAKAALNQDHNIATVATLAQTIDTHPAYDSHQTLRATRTVVSGRAQALINEQTSIPPQAGTSAVMPRWTDLRIYVSAEFDVGSGISFAFGVRGFWWISDQTSDTGQAKMQGWDRVIYTVKRKSLEDERRALFRFLNRINQMMTVARARHQSSTVQIYMWDSVTYNHLTRVIGRHLDAILDDGSLSRLAWIFPPEEVVANPEFSSRRTPITIVRDVVKAVLAAPIAHHYGVVDVANIYHHPNPSVSPPFNVMDLYRDPLSDQIPSERAHDIWSRASTPDQEWRRRLRFIHRTVKTKLRALETVARRLGNDLEHLKQTAPRISDLRPPILPNGLAQDCRLWYIYACLNAALDALEVSESRAMPPHEREARFTSARLTRRLTGPERADVLNRFDLSPFSDLWVYELAPNSREVKLREGDFTFAIAPDNRPEFLDTRLSNIAGGIGLPTSPWGNLYQSMERVCQVTVRAIDRIHGFLVLDIAQGVAQGGWLPAIGMLEQQGLVDLSRNAILDKVHKEYLTEKLLPTLQSIGNPAIATTAEGVTHALGRDRNSPTSSQTPVADVLWNAASLEHADTVRILDSVRQFLSEHRFGLNPFQWNAWQAALTHRLRLIWGPPGTGKSRTLKAIIAGAVIEAHQQEHPLRLLICGPTYKAIDNVLLGEDGNGVYHWLLENTTDLGLRFQVIRLRSRTHPQEAYVPNGIDWVVGNDESTAEIQENLENNTAGIFIVSGTPQQVHKLLAANQSNAVREFFDLIVLDEASQVDVAQGILALSGLAEGGSVIVAGDPLQLDPIHSAEPPLGLEYMVGSIYQYLEERHNLTAERLLINYRSNRQIVEFAQRAGYPADLRSHSSNLSLVLTSPPHMEYTAPPGWPEELYWTPEWNTFLDPTLPTVCFTYPEGRSSQWNHFEADAVCALAWLLNSRIETQLANELSPTNELLPTTGVACSAQEFWSRGIGVVTPHRAQMSLIVAKLQNIFAGQEVEPQWIRDAVDTVERFQGQQRDVIIGTFALGDPDAIRDEEEFLLSLNRFNVMASRARAKLIVFVSQEVINHLSNDIDVLKNSRLLKAYAETYCSQNQLMELGHLTNSGLQVKTGSFRWHE